MAKDRARTRGAGLPGVKSSDPIRETAPDLWESKLRWRHVEVYFLAFVNPFPGQPLLPLTAGWPQAQPTRRVFERPAMGTGDSRGPRGDDLRGRPR